MDGPTERTPVRDVRQVLPHHETIVETVGDAIYQLDLDGRFVMVNDVVTEVTGFSRDRLIGSPVSLLLDAEDIATCTSVIQRLAENDDEEVGVAEITVRTADGETIPGEVRLALLRTAGQVSGSVGVVRDVSERKDRERQLRKQRDELEELNRINAVIRDVNEALVEATTRETLAADVCRRLAGADPYRFTWVGEVSQSTGTVTPIAWAGVRDDVLSDVEVDLEDPSASPIVSALETGKAEEIENVDSDAADGLLPEEAVEVGFRSAATVPLSYQGSAYGVLNLYADRSDAFNRRELAVLTELGEGIAHAVNAIGRKEALMTDRVNVLQFHSVELTEHLVEALDETATIGIERVIPLKDGGHLMFYSVEGIGGERFLEAVERNPTVVDVRRIGEDDDRTRFEANVTGETIVSTIAAQGGRLEHAAIDQEGLTVVAEFAAGIDVRRVVNAVQDVFPSAELVSQSTEERQRSLTAGSDRLLERLSKRQRDALEVAYYSGYYEWPRETTGEQVAESLGVAPPTFNEYIRVAERKLVDTALSDSS